MRIGWAPSKREDMLLDVFPGVVEQGLVKIYNDVLDTQEDVALPELTYDFGAGRIGYFEIRFAPISKTRVAAIFTRRVPKLR